MSRRLLSEQEEVNKDVLEIAIVKSIAQSPLTLEELENLENVDIATLIVEHNLSYPEANIVVNWCRNEVYRHNAQDVSYGTPGDVYLDADGERDTRGIKAGSVYPRLRESTHRSKRSLRSIIQEEINNLFKKNKR